jgi:hypothetical protein
MRNTKDKGFEGTKVFRIYLGQMYKRSFENQKKKVQN